MAEHPKPQATAASPARAPTPAPVADLAWPPGRARELGDAVVDLWAELLERLPELPAGKARTVEEVQAAVVVPVPDEPWPVGKVVDYLRTLVFEHSIYPGHPGFMAYISGAGTVPGAAADLVAAALNQNVGGWRLSPGATEIEQGLLRWFAGRLGLPETAGGLITSGGAMSAFVGLKAARDARAGTDVRRHGVAAGPPLTLYASAEVHDVNTRAADMLGLGADAVRLIPTDDGQRMRVDALREAVARDRAEGRRPIAVVGTAGTVTTGAIDPLDAIADVCEECGAWFHVDGAYGGVAALVDELRPRFRGIERADSVVLDPHKWLYTPHSGGAIVVRDLQWLADAFAVDPTYVHEDKAHTGSGIDAFSLGPQFSRGFHALKVWISLLAHGWNAYRRRILHDIELAEYLDRRVREHDELEPLAPPSLSIATFRYVPRRLGGTAAAGATDPAAKAAAPDESGSSADRRATPPARDDATEAYLDRLNERLMTALQHSGCVFPSNAVVGGRFGIRACIVNFRTEAADIDALVEAALRLGRELDTELQPA